MGCISHIRKRRPLQRSFIKQISQRSQPHIFPFRTAKSISTLNPVSRLLCCFMREDSIPITCKKLSVSLRTKVSAPTHPVYWMHLAWSPRWHPHQSGYMHQWVWSCCTHRISHSYLQMFSLQIYINTLKSTRYMISHTEQAPWRNECMISQFLLQTMY